MRFLFLTAVMIAAVACTSPDSRYFSDDPVPVTPKGRKALFNGKDYKGWDLFMRDDAFAGAPEDVFTVKDGVMHITGKGYGGCTTVKAYKDYHLTMEYRYIGDAFADRTGKAADGGLLFHCVGPEGVWGGIWHLSFECNIIQGRTADFIVVGAPDRYPGTLSAKAYVDSLQRWTPDASKEKVLEMTDVGMVNNFYCDCSWADVDTQGISYPEKPYGEWNAIELICKDDTAEFILNGVTMLKLFDLKPSAGRIQLQSECHGIEYRNIYIEGLDCSLR